MAYNIETTIPAYATDEFLKLVKRAKKNISELDWTVGESYNRVFRHFFDGEIVKMTHKVVDITLSVPEVNDWVLLATIVDGSMFVADQKHKLELHDGHGTEYRLCDVCKHKQWKKSYIVRNSKTGEELQIGAECAKKFGIGMMNAIHNLTKELYASYSLYSCEYDGLEPIEWPARFNDSHAVRSVETSAVVIAAKQYYDDHNGKWLKGYYQGSIYYPSESAADIRSLLEDVQADSENAYYKELTSWIKDVFVADEWSEFDEKIKAVGTDYYTSAGDTAAVFFAIKKFEAYKKEQAAKAAGIYIPKRGDYIHIIGKIVSEKKKCGTYGVYVEYVIENTLDGYTYTRSGAVKADSEKNVDCFAYIKDAYGGNYTLDRTTQKPKKGVVVANTFQ